MISRFIIEKCEFVKTYLVKAFIHNTLYRIIWLWLINKLLLLQVLHVNGISKHLILYLLLIFILHDLLVRSLYCRRASFTPLFHLLETHHLLIKRHAVTWIIKSTCGVLVKLLALHIVEFNFLFLSYHI